jgi:hypothetical protein
MKISDDIRLIGIRVLAIMYICMIYVVFGIMITYWLDEFGYHDIFVDSQDDTNESIPKLIFELGIMVGILGVIAFLGRSVIQQLPFPFDGAYGFDYDNMRELTSGAVFFVIMFNFSAVINHKIIYIQARFNRFKKRKYEHVIHISKA